MKDFIPFIFLTLTLIECTTKEAPKTINKNWKGEWERDIWQSGATLKITSVDADSIGFSIFAISGSHSGELEGKIHYDNNTAVYSLTGDDDSCYIEFNLSGDSIITIEQKHGMCDAGMGVSYTGTYVNSKLLATKSKKEMSLVELQVFKNNREDSTFRSLVGNDYSLFLNSTQFSSEDPDLDRLNSRVVSSGVRGLYSYMENIIMIDSMNNIWAAVLNDDQKLLYYTNRKDFSDTLPITIHNWRKRFEEYEAVYKSKE